MAFSYDLPGLVVSSVLTPATTISANTNTAVLDLSPYQGAVAIIANIGANTAGDAATKWTGTVYDSADNSTFAVSAGTNAFTNVTNANSYQTLDLDTRGAKRYMKVVMTLSNVNAVYPVALQAVGVYEHTPNAV